MLAIIPARGGSKGVPGKNIKPLDGKPLIAYTIEAAKSSKLVDRIVVSTDDETIAEVSKLCGAEVPFMRPADLAQDQSLAIDTYFFTINRLNELSSRDYETFIVLQPTSPLRTSEDIDSAIQLFCDKKAESVISVCEALHPPLWAKEITNEGILKNYFNNLPIMKNRQELVKAFMPNGAVYILNFNLLKRNLSYYSEKTYAYIMPYERSIDIDNPLDFEFAEYLIKKNNHN